MFPIILKTKINIFQGIVHIDCFLVNVTTPTLLEALKFVISVIDTASKYTGTLIPLYDSPTDELQKYSLVFCMSFTFHFDNSSQMQEFVHDLQLGRFRR